MRFYLGVGRYTPSAGVAGDMGWTPTLIRQWKSVSNVWSRHSVLPNSRINKRIFMYAYQNGNNRCKNWPFRIKTHLRIIPTPWEVTLSRLLPIVSDFERERHLKYKLA